MESREAVYLPGRDATFVSRVEAAVRDANLPRLAAVAFQFALLVGLRSIFMWNTARSGS